MSPRPAAPKGARTTPADATPTVRVEGRRAQCHMAMGEPGDPPDQREKVDPNVLNGPVVNPEGRTNVVANQGEVDYLLASLGFQHDIDRTAGPVGQVHRAPWRGGAGQSVAASATAGGSRRGK